MTFLEKLDYQMNKHKKSRADVAEGTGIPRSTIDNWFSREENNPKREALVLLAKYFNVSLSYLCVDEKIKDNINDESIPNEPNNILIFKLDEDMNASDFTKREREEILNFIKFIDSKRKK